MIAYVEGRLLRVLDGGCIVLTAAGVGYILSLPAHAMAELPEAGQPAAFFTFHVVREDAQELYGFASLEERQTFEALLGISKIGARTALAILSRFRPDELARLALNGDPADLTSVPGIGQKTAQHVFLELKYKLRGLNIVPAEAAREGACAPASPVLRDSLSALVNLGYAEEECLEHVRQILAAEPDLDVAGVIRAALKALSGRKN